jgi:type IV secretory pathway VirB10-like protein
MTKPAADSAVFARTPQLRVTQPSSPWNLALGLALCAVLGVIVFASLSGGRQARAQVAAPPAPVSAPAAPQPPSASLAMAEPAPPAATPAPPSSDPTVSWRAPAVVVDLGEPPAAAAPAGPTPTPQATTTPATRDDSGASSEDRFSAKVASSGVETAHATRLRNLTYVAPQGTMIPAVLETAINSDLPGSVRAVVSQDVRGFDGAAVLIPRGSKLIGQYRNGVALGQSRAFVVWSRILTPDGVSVDIGSPATDPLGRGGLAGQTDTHFLARFGGAILLTVLDVGVDAALSRSGGNTAIIIGSTDPASHVTAAVPQQGAIPVTVKVAQGAPLEVFVTRDLDFSGLAVRR